MICPHCKEIISIRVTTTIIAKVKAYRKKRYTYREIAIEMAKDGYHVSHTTVGKILKGIGKGV